MAVNSWRRVRAWFEAAGSFKKHCGVEAEFPAVGVLAHGRPAPQESGSKKCQKQHRARGQRKGCVTRISAPRLELFPFTAVGRTREGRSLAGFARGSRGRES